MAQELRCDSKMHAVLIPDANALEVKCNSRFCGAAKGVVVLHRFDLTTGEIVTTKQYRDPERNK